MSSKKHARSPSHHNDPGLQHPSTKVAKKVDASPPFEQLTSLLDSSTTEPENPKTILHWFRSKDLRAHDNKALTSASKYAKEKDATLITCYLHSPKDLEWHGTSPARTDFILENLKLLKQELEQEKNIPLAILTAKTRGEKSDKVMEFVRKYNVGKVYANFEYEVDELRRDVEFVETAAQQGVGVELCHDQTVLVPGTLTTGSGGPMKVFTPYHKAWLAETKEDPSLWELAGEVEGNGKGVREDDQDVKGLFGGKVPDLPKEKGFEGGEEERKRIRELWPAGHEKGMERLRRFLGEKVKDYARHRSEPARDPTSRLGAYISAGVVSIREILQECAKQNGKGKHFDEGDAGIASWVRELVFREFYRQVTVVTPHGNMNLPQNLKFDFVEWEDDEEGYKKWEEGRTGMPFVDAGMRQLNTEGYMHNRLRMNTSSYLRANLLIDYRRGERYFAQHLIDWDLSNNTQGWEPSYTIFNPVVQAEKCDPEGEYIRKWVPELKDLKGKEIFDPYHRLGKEEFEKLGYPEPHVDFKESQQRAKERYKRDLAEADP